MRSIVVAISTAALLAGCVTNGGSSTNTSSALSTTEATAVGGHAPTAKSVGAGLDVSRHRPVGGPHTQGVMDMEWPEEIAPYTPVQRRLFTVSPQSDHAFRMKLEAIPVSDKWGHHISRDLVDAMFSYKNGAQLLSALDFARDRVLDDSLSTQFLLAYSLMLTQAYGLQDGVASAIIAADVTTLIDSARCRPTPGDRYTGLLSRRRDYAKPYEIAREYLATASKEDLVDVVRAVRSTERRSAPIRRDVNLCRFGTGFRDLDTLRKVECSQPSKRTTCYAASDNKAVPTRWADEEEWRKARIAILEDLTPEKLIEIYSKPLPAAM